MEGIATMETDAFVQEPEAKTAQGGYSFGSSVQQSLQHYFAQLDGAEPANVYGMVLAEMEVPLLKVVMRFTNGNQSKAAKILGISRGTLRKKLAIYQIDDDR